MKLILVRHGETEENSKNLIIGHSEATLSGKGIKQIKKLAERLKDEKIDIIYSSDLSRAAETAKEIAKYHPNIPIHFVKELRERDFGKFDGKETPKNWKEFSFSPNIFYGERGEEVVEVYNRAKNFLKDVLSKYPNKTVLFVAHGTFNRILVTSILNRSCDRVGELDTQRNTAISIFEFEKNKNPKMILFNCINHLK